MIAGINRIVAPSPRLCLGLVGAVCLLTNSVQAGTVTQLVYAPEYNPGDAPDFNPGEGPDVDVWALRVTADTDWTNARMIVEMTEGEMIHVLHPSFAFSDFPVPGLVLTIGDRALPDTAVFGPVTPGALSELGSPFNEAPGFEETPTRFEAGWFGNPTDTSNIGTFDIAMIATTPCASFRVTGTIFSGSEAEPLNIVSSLGGLSGHNCVPEPSALLLALLLTLAAGPLRRHF